MELTLGIKPSKFSIKNLNYNFPCMCLYRQKEVVVLVSILNYFPLKMQRTIYISILPDPSGDHSAGHTFFSNYSCKQYGESNAVGLPKKGVY